MKERRIIILLALLLIIPIAYRCSRSFEWNMLKDPEPVGQPKPTFTDLLATIARPSPSQLNEQLDLAPELVNERAPLGVTLLEAAVNARCRDCITALARHGADLELKTSTGITPLELALQQDNPGPIFELIHQGAKADLTPEARIKLAKQAIRHDDAQVLEVLLGQGLGPDQPLDDRNTLLTSALDRFAVFSVQILLQAGADPNLPQPGPHGKRPLEIVDDDFNCCRESYEIFETLLQFGADPNLPFSNGDLLLNRMINRHHLHSIELLKSYGADPFLKNRHGSSAIDEWDVTFQGPEFKKKDIDPHAYPLHVLIEMQWVDRARRLLESDPSLIDQPPAPGAWPPLWRAASWGQRELVDYLLEQGASVTDDQTEPGLLHVAAAARMNDLIRTLLVRGLNVNQPDRAGQTPLHLSGGAETSALLIDHGADVNRPDNYGCTPLLHSHRLETIVVLIDHGADVNAQCGALQTPLVQAIRISEEAALYLLDHGAGYETPLTNPGDVSALARAVLSDYDAVALRLIEMGADVNQKLPDGRPLLHLAAMQCRVKIVKSMLAHGADLAARDQEGFTVLVFLDHHRNDSNHENACHLSRKDYARFREDLEQKGAKR